MALHNGSSKEARGIMKIGDLVRWHDTGARLIGIVTKIDKHWHTVYWSNGKVLAYPRWKLIKL